MKYCWKVKLFVSSSVGVMLKVLGCEPRQKTPPGGYLYHSVQSLPTLCVLEKTSLMKDSCKRQVKCSSLFSEKLRDLHGQINGGSS